MVEKLRTQTVPPLKLKAIDPSERNVWKLCDFPNQSPIPSNLVSSRSATIQFCAMCMCRLTLCGFGFIPRSNRNG